MSVLSDSQIESSLKAGDLVILPFRKEQLNNSSYDVTLGNWYYLPQADFTASFFNHESQSDIDAYWGSPLYAEEEIVIPPNTTFLCHTEEYIGGVNNITTMLKAKSTLGRCCVSVCQCAGWGDVGYFNRWTMEVRNQMDVTQRLRVGARVAQVIFFPTGEATSYSRRGRYQTAESFEDVCSSWKPEMMKPSAVRI
jgi:dCTP deaminase